MRFWLAAHIRVRDWWYLTGIYFLGILIGDGRNASVPAIVVGCVCVCFYLAHGYLTNDYWDQIVVQPGVSKRDKNLAAAVMYALLFLGVGASLFLSRWITLLVVMGGVFSYVYSGYPVRVKRFPVWALVLNALGFSVLFLIGCLIDGALTLSEIYFYGAVTLLLLPVELIHDVNDMVEDIRDGIDSFATRYGLKKTMGAVVALYVLLGVFSFLLYDRGIIGMYFPLFTVSASLAVVAIVVVSYRKNGGSFVLYKGIKRRVRLVLSLYGIGLLLGLSFF